MSEWRLLPPYHPEVPHFGDTNEGDYKVEDHLALPRRMFVSKTARSGVLALERCIDYRFLVHTHIKSLSNTSDAAQKSCQSFPNIAFDIEC